MDTILHSGWGITIILILLFMAALIIAAFIFVEWGVDLSKQAAEYEKKYNRIDKLIFEASINEQNYDWLNKLIDHLRELPYKNSEMTEILDQKFRIKFSDIIIKRKVEEMI